MITPTSTPGANEPQPEMSTPQAMMDGLPRGRDELVLVVDDDSLIRDITQRILTTFGYRVLTATNGAEAVAIYTERAEQIAVVITDIKMPVMDGPTAMLEFQRVNPAVKIIAASGLNSFANVSRATQASVRAILHKPFTLEFLVQLVRDVLDGLPTNPAQGGAERGRLHVDQKVMKNSTTR